MDMKSIFEVFGKKNFFVSFPFKKKYVCRVLLFTEINNDCFVSRKVKKIYLLFIEWLINN